ncbi:hypothetical protein F4824DRAFT_497414 [Ustulina deusta]|nr:hypothetical protein F4824DRAFT_497414 [Ustulina deusta]
MGYEEVNQSEESLLPREGPRSKWQIKSSSRGRRAWLLTGFNIALFLTSVLLLGTELEKQLKKYEMQMNSTLFAPPRPSKYRNTIKPSKEVDDAWGALEWVQTFLITGGRHHCNRQRPEGVQEVPMEDEYYRLYGRKRWMWSMDRHMSIWEKVGDTNNAVESLV